jgi:hypothetical protein
MKFLYLTLGLFIAVSTTMSTDANATSATTYTCSCVEKLYDDEGLPYLSAVTFLYSEIEYSKNEATKDCDEKDDGADSTLMNCHIEIIDPAFGEFGSSE